MSNAAIYLHPEGFNTDVARLMGRHSAGESFLRGFLRHADVDQFHFWNVAGRPTSELEALVRKIEPPRKPCRMIAMRNRPGLADPGCLNLPGPGLGEEARLRRTNSAGAYSLCGITHTTATSRIMDAIADLLIGPVEPWDGLICTSSAVRASVEAQLQAVREDLTSRLGATRLTQPLLATIPLGVNVDDFAPSEEARKAWRTKLGVPDDAVVALYMGRLNFAAKMNPAMMALALEAAAKASGREVHWIVAGWAESPELETMFHNGNRRLCPSVRYHSVDGRPADARFSIWHAADLFISFSDNIQETFGLTPVEAMAAGLPSVVSDWNGYRDTVRDGVDGFRIPTIAPRPGLGRDLAYMHASNWIPYGGYVGAAAQLTAVDLTKAVEALVNLIENPDLRARMGAAARTYARETFDWSAIVPQYQSLWRELGQIRAAASPGARAANGEDPNRMDPFRLFYSYPTRFVTPRTPLKPAPGVSWADAEVRLGSEIARFADFALPTLDEARQMYEFVAGLGRAEAGEIAAQFPPVRQGVIERGVGWLLKFGVLALDDPPPRP